MFKIFRIKKEDIDSLRKYSSEEYYNFQYQSYLCDAINSIDNFSKNYYDTKGNISAEKIMNDFFPNNSKLGCEIFISHSHQDENSAKFLVGWLRKEFNINAFVDSIFWKYYLGIQELIDREQNDRDKISSYSISIAQNLLLVSLAKMMDSCEVLLFIDSENSRDRTYQKDNTLSPWIFAELQLKDVLRINLPKKRPSFVFSTEQLTESKNIVFPVNTSDLPVLTKENLDLWVKYFKNIPFNGKYGYSHPLDTLYKIKGMASQ